MTQETTSGLDLEQLTPFGMVVRARRSGTDLRTLPVSVLNGWVEEHRVVVLRRFAPLVERALPEFCERLGQLLEWDFGAVNDLSIRDDARNYLYTNRAVPFHWDGAFIGRAPRYIFFHCDAAPARGSGGETLFCDTKRLLERAPPERREIWEQTVITYTTEKIVHYGGSFSSPVITRHPSNGGRVLRYAEPVSDLNPVRLEITGIADGSREEFIEDMHRRLNDESVCYRHEWMDGDVVIADNHVLLHGRRAFDKNAARHIRRVNIL